MDKKEYFYKLGLLKGEKELRKINEEPPLPTETGGQMWSSETHPIFYENHIWYNKQKEALDNEMLLNALYQSWDLVFVHVDNIEHLSDIEKNILKEQEKQEVEMRISFGRINEETADIEYYLFFDLNDDPMPSYNPFVNEKHIIRKSII